MSDETRGSSLGARHLDLAFDADPAVLSMVRAQVADWLRQHRWQERRIVEVVLAVNEAITNSIQHAYAVPGGRIGVRAEVTVPYPGMGVATVAVADQGRWRPPPPGTPGYGLTVIRGLMEDVRIDTGAGGTTVGFSTPVVALESP